LRNSDLLGKHLKNTSVKKKSKSATALLANFTSEAVIEAQHRPLSPISLVSYGATQFVVYACHE